MDVASSASNGAITLSSSPLNPQGNQASAQVAADVSPEEPLLRGARREQVTIPILAETLDRIHAVFADRGWDEVTGFHLLLGAGLAQLEAEQIPSEVRDAWIEQRLFQLEGDHAALKFRAYELSESNRILQLNVAGLRGEVEIGVRTLGIFRADNRRLQEELQDLRAHFQAADAVSMGPAEQPSSLPNRPRGLLQRAAWRLLAKLAGSGQSESDRDKGRG